jgi:CRP/FNR family cyclic AMP-dependent transcriptional regulator
MTPTDAFGEDPTYFPYPTLAPTPQADEPSAFLESATDEDWQALLDATDTVRFAPGDVVAAEGAGDRALYLLVDGRVRAAGGEVTGAPATLGAVTLLTGRPRTEAITGETHGEALRLSHDGLETLAARDPQLGRAVVAELARLVAERLHAVDGPRAEWTV